MVSGANPTTGAIISPEMQALHEDMQSLKTQVTMFTEETHRRIEAMEQKKNEEISEINRKFEVIMHGMAHMQASNTTPPAPAAALANITLGSIPTSIQSTPLNYDFDVASGMKRAAYYSCVPQMQDHWPIKKALTLSDVDITHPFLTLSRQQVENHIVLHMTTEQQEHLRAQGQVDFNARDDDTGEMYVMKLKWRGSYYNLIGKWGRVVRGKGLDVGQEIKIRWENGCLHFSVPQQQIVAVPPIRMVAAPVVQDHWPIKKILTLSDVDTNHPFLPLPRRLVEDHILVHWTPQQQENLRKEEHVNVNARDYDTGEAYIMKFKWRGNYYNLIGKWGTIIRQKGLGVGKEIRLRWANECLFFSVPQERYVATASGMDNWPIKKALTLSDVDTNHPFLTLPGKAVEDHILFYWSQQAREQLRNDHQMNINARDDDNGDAYLMKLRWRGSYYNLIGKWGKIIRGKKLQVGMEIRLRWDNGCLFFSVSQL